MNLLLSANTAGGGTGGPSLAFVTITSELAARIVALSELVLQLGVLRIQEHSTVPRWLGAPGEPVASLAYPRPLGSVTLSVTANHFYWEARVEGSGISVVTEPSPIDCLYAHVAA